MSHHYDSVFDCFIVTDVSGYAMYSFNTEEEAQAFIYNYNNENNQ